MADLTSDFDGAWYAVFGGAARRRRHRAPQEWIYSWLRRPVFLRREIRARRRRGFRSLVKVSHYAGDRAVSVFGEFGPFATLESFHAELRGAQDSNGTLQLSGGVTGDPDRRLDVALKLSRLVPNPVRQA